MHAIGADFQGQVRAVIDEHCHIMFVRDGDQCRGSLDDLAITDILEPQLHTGDVAGAQRIIKDARKRRQVVETRRRDQVKAASRLGGL